MSTPLALERLRLSKDRVQALTGRKTVTAGPTADLPKWLADQGITVGGRVTVCQVEITPSLAKEWLKFNLRNRKPSNPKIRRFARMMKEGRWSLNGEMIKFGASGRLLDGQSRLQAIVQADVPVVIEVRGGLPEQAQESMDTGEARKHSHQLEMLGEKNPNEVAAALRLVYFWEKGYIGSCGSSGDGTRDITNTTIRETLERHSDVRSSVGRCLNLKALMPVSAAAFFHYIFSRVDTAKANTFIERLTTGANLSATSAIYQLRERLTQDRLAQAKIGRRERFALIVKAWNAYRNGKPVTRLGFNASEEFPVVSGLEKGASC
jgi:hypothetical protein